MWGLGFRKAPCVSVGGASAMCFGLDGAVGLRMGSFLTKAR